MNSLIDLTNLPMHLPKTIELVDLTNLPINEPKTTESINLIKSSSINIANTTDSSTIKSVVPVFSANNTSNALFSTLEDNALNLSLH
jgi:hypothetical protein